MNHRPVAQRERSMMVARTSDRPVAQRDPPIAQMRRSRATYSQCKRECKCTCLCHKDVWGRAGCCVRTHDWCWCCL